MCSYYNGVCTILVAALNQRSFKAKERCLFSTTLWLQMSYVIENVNGAVYH